MKKKLQLTQIAINRYADFFNEQRYVNFFSQKNVYLSNNFSFPNIRQMIGDLGGVPVNVWKEESMQTDIFLISTEDFEDLKSNEVQFINKLINKKQTILDTKKSYLSSNIFIVKESDFIPYVNDRKLGDIVEVLKIHDTKELKQKLYIDLSAEY